MNTYAKPTAMHRINARWRAKRYQEMKVTLKKVTRKKKPINLLVKKLGS